MTVKIYFETLASGMRAKLDARYRTGNIESHSIRKLYGNGSRSAMLDDAIGKCQPSNSRKYR